jgi:hypothetical protein
VAAHGHRAHPEPRLSLRHGGGASSGFNNGMAIYQVTDKGLMLQADISGTKYWKNGKLNR